MSKEIRTEIRINASVEHVWKILTNFRMYPEWNPFIRTIEGALSVGNKLKIRIEPPGASGIKFQPTVKTYFYKKRLSWLGHVLVPGFFDGEHIFELIDNGHSTTFIHKERFSGILLPLFRKMIEVNTKNGFVLMNEKLKQRCEETFTVAKHLVQVANSLH